MYLISLSILNLANARFRQKIKTSKNWQLSWKQFFTTGDLAVCDNDTNKNESWHNEN